MNQNRQFDEVIHALTLAETAWTVQGTMFYHLQRSTLLYARSWITGYEIMTSLRP
jgi:hypothetical protein